MNFQHFSFKWHLCAFCVVVPFFMAACGDSGSDSDFEDPSDIDEICEDDFCDSESSDSDGKSAGKNSSGAESSSSFQKKEADISASSYTDSSLVGEKFKSDIGDLNILKGTVYDSTYNREYKTVTIGPYTWIAENLEYATTAFENYDMCYDNSDANCKSDGRLFKPAISNYMCPDGFFIPTIYDYKYLVSVTADLTNKTLGFNPQFAGYCKQSDFDRDSIGCADIDKKTYLMAESHNLFIIDASGYASTDDAETNGFYSLRCVRMSAFVDNEKQLPICNSKTEDDLDDIFVASAEVNYFCNGSKWVKGSDKDCPWGDRGEKHYYGDKLYICSNDGTWKLADFSDVGAECSAKNDGDVQELNGVKYICDDSTWREPTATEKSIGLCTSKNIGAIDTIPVGASLDFYYCDTTGWRTARLVDYVGKCEESKFYKIVEFSDTKYTCRTDSTWEKFTTLETKVGLCTPKKIGIIDSVKQGESYDPYFCDSTGWRAAKLADYAGKCDDSKFYKTIDFGTVSYACRTDSSWTKLSTTETKIGVCSPKNRGAIDSINSIIYVCDTTDWKVATIYDIFECSSAKINSTVKFKDNTYGCNDDLQWTPVTDTTKALGYCTSKNYGTIKFFKSLFNRFF